MKFKKLIFLSLLTVGLFSGLSYLSNSVNASQITNFNNIKTSQPEYRGSKSYSTVRKNRYKIIWTKNIKPKYFNTMNDVNDNKLYSKNIAYKYPFKINWNRYDMYIWRADKQQKIYSKKTKKYYIYYRIKSVNSNVSGWTWAGHLTPYQDINNKYVKQLSKMFKGTNLDAQTQYLANYETSSFKLNSDYFNFFASAFIDSDESNEMDLFNHLGSGDISIGNPFYAAPGKTKAQKNLNNKKIGQYYLQLKNNKMNLSNYLNNIIKIMFPDRNNMKWKNIGFYVYPKSSKYYGNIGVVMTK